MGYLYDVDYDRVAIDNPRDGSHSGQVWWCHLEGCRWQIDNLGVQWMPRANREQLVDDALHEHFEEEWDTHKSWILGLLAECGCPDLEKRKGHLWSCFLSDPAEDLKKTAALATEAADRLARGLWIDPSLMSSEVLSCGRRAGKSYALDAAVRRLLVRESGADSAGQA